MSQNIITIVNQKGGVGKTTTAINAASYLAGEGRKILLVDLDSQGNATSGLGVKPLNNSIYQIMLGSIDAKSAIVKTSIKGLDIITSNPSLSAFESESSQIENREFILKKALDALDYDYIFIDCPPSLGVLTINALTAANNIIITVQSEYYALEGLSQLLNTIQLVKENTNPDLNILGVLMTMYDKRTSLSQQVKSEVENYFGDLVFKTSIPRNVRLAEAPSHGQSIFQYDSWSRGSKSYKSLGKEILKRTTN